MRSSAVALFAGLFMVLFSLSAALSAEPRVFKNSDLEKFSSGSESKSVEPSISSDTGNRQKAESSLSDRKYWCTSATEADSRIKRAEENLAQANYRKGVTWRSLNSGNRFDAVEADGRAQKNLESAEAELAEAKQEKARLENEAHQKNIPAGWLRCQFE
ncbi:MAG: hypothetical protein C0402_15000 [Thermodesulfovibrio sp.]|nr:hypothetical protein [Thermodesulfovibrio sp.]